MKGDMGSQAAVLVVLPVTNSQNLPDHLVNLTVTQLVSVQLSQHLVVSFD